MNGILFKPDMIEAIVDGRKTVTRRLGGLKEINQEPDKWELKGKDLFRYWLDETGLIFKRIDTSEERIIKPRYRVRMYIKEAWATENQYNHLKPSEIPHTAKLFYMLTDGYYPIRMGLRRTPMFMPEWAARYHIKILDARAERLGEITEEDIEKEGFVSIDPYRLHRAFGDLWDSINPKYPFASNPWVWRYELERNKE